MIRAILFDLDGTLVDRDASVRSLVEAQWHSFAPALAHVPRATYVEHLLALDAHGHGDKTVIYQQITETFGLPVEMAATLVTNFWKNYTSHARLYPEVLPVLRALRARGLKLGLVTNGTVAVQEAVIAELGLTSVFDVVLISEREGVRKPQREIFARAVTAMGVAPTEAWFVGDHPTADIEAGATAGLTAIWRRNNCWAPPSGSYHTVDTMNDVIGLLDTLPLPAHNER